MYSAFTLTALVLASISSARHEGIKWRPGVEQGGIQWAGDVGPQTAIKPLTTDGKPIDGYAFTPGIKIDGEYKYPSVRYSLYFIYKIHHRDYDQKLMGVSVKWLVS